MSPIDPDLARALSKMMRADLEVWSNWWFWSLVGSTIAVAIGIICEAPEVWQAVGLGRKAVARIRKFWYVRVRKIDLNGWERLCPELITTNERHRKWIARAGFLGWTLVALGVAGEGAAEYFVNDAETNLRAFDQAVLIETQQSANSAAMASSLANTFSDKAVAASSSSLTLAKGARAEVDSIKGDLTSARANLSELTKAQAVLKWDINSVATRASGRHLSVPRFLAQLKGKVKGKATLLYKPEDEEARKFAWEIRHWLGHGEPESAGWDVPEPQPIPPGFAAKYQTGWTDTGIIIVCKNLGPPFDETAGRVIGRALSLGLAGGGGMLEASEPTLGENEVIIIIGQHTFELPNEYE